MMKLFIINSYNNHTSLMSVEELLTILTHVCHPQSQEQCDEATAQYALIKDNPQLFPFLSQLLQTDITPQIYVCSLKMLEGISKKLEISQEHKIELIVNLILMYFEKSEKILFQCIESYVNALTVPNFQETYQNLMEKCEKEEQVVQITQFFIKRRVRTRSQWQIFDNCFDQCLNIIVNQLKLGSEGAVKIFTQLYFTDPTDNRNTILNEVIQILIDNEDIKISQKLEFIQSLLETNNRLNNIQNMRQISKCITEFQLILRGQFQKVFQFVLDQLSSSHNESELFHTFVILAYVVKSQFYPQLGQELHKQLFGAAIETLQTLFESQCLQEDLELEVNLVFDIGNSDNHLFILNGINVKEQILIDQVIIFIQKFFLAMSEPMLVQYIQEYLQIDTNFFYKNSILLIASYQALKSEDTKKELYQGILAQFSTYLSQSYSPMVIATSIWAIKQLLIYEASEEFLVAIINNVNQMLKQPRTQLEFYMLITAQTTFFDHFKRNEYTVQFSDILQTNLNLLLMFDQNFQYYPEIIDLCIISCDVLSRLNPEEVSYIYAEFFKTYIQNNEMVLTQLTDLLAIFGKIFVYKESEIDGDLYLLYFEILYSSILQLLTNFKKNDYDHVQKICKSFVYLFTNLSTIEVFPEIQGKIIELVKQLLQFVGKFGDDNCYLIAELLFVLTDVFVVTEHSQELNLIFVPLFKEIDLQEFNALGFLLRLCVGNCIRYNVNVEDYQVLFEFSTNLNLIDITFDVFMTSIYLNLINLSIFSGQNLFNEELNQIVALKNYFPKHLQRLWQKNAFTNNFSQCFLQFSHQFQEYQELYDLFQNRNLQVCEQVVKQELELPELDLYEVKCVEVLQERYQNKYEICELEEFCNVFENIKLLSDDMRTMTNTQ